MKTGFNLVEDNSKDVELINETTATVSAFMELSLIVASEYIKHCNRKVITVTDIELCMKYEALRFTRNPNILCRIEKWKQIIQEEDTEEEEEDISVNEEDENEEFTKSKCSCSLCQEINNIDDEYYQWEPFSPIEKAIKNTIDKFY